MIAVAPISFVHESPNGNVLMLESVRAHESNFSESDEADGDLLLTLSDMVAGSSYLVDAVRILSEFLLNAGSREQARGLRPVHGATEPLGLGEVELHIRHIRSALTLLFS